jgi:two-component system LytT family sensor kinase
MLMRQKELSAPLPRAFPFWPVQIAAWSGYWLLMAGSRIGRFPFAYMVTSKALLALLGCAISGVLLRPTYRRILERDLPLWTTIMVTAGLSYVAACVWTVADGFADLPLQAQMLAQSSALTSPWQLIGGTLYNSITLFAWSASYMTVRHQEDLQRTRERALRAEALAQSARLDVLRAQVSPHFLFNTLNAISTLVLDNRPREATLAISRLASLLRTTMSRDDGFVPLVDEIRSVLDYLSIEELRLGARLSAEVFADTDADGVFVPSFILQPLVENAVRHAVAEREAPGRIEIRTSRVGQRVRVTVDDDGPGLVSTQMSTPARTGIGLANVRGRLTQLFGEDQSLTLGRSTLGGVRVALEFPIRE